MSAMATAGPGPPSVDDIDRIRAIDRAPLRNLHITHAYHDLAAGLAARTGGGANWCSFATWASRQAGKTIRGEDLLETYEPERRAHAAAWIRIATEISEMMNTLDPEVAARRDAHMLANPQPAGTPTPPLGPGLHGDASVEGPTAVRSARPSTARCWRW